MKSGALDSSGVLLPYPLTSLAYLITTILIVTLKHQTAKDIDDLKKRTSSSIADEVFTQWESNISLNSNSKSADNLSELDDIMPAAEGEQNAAIQILQNLFRAVENFLNNVELDTDENPSPQSC